MSERILLRGGRVVDPASDRDEVGDVLIDDGLVDVFPVGAITRALAGEELAEIGEMVEAGVRVLSDDGHCVPSARVLRNAMTYAKAFEGIVIAEHCEDA